MYHKLDTIGTCCDATHFASQYETLQGAWGACESPGWLLWFLFRTSGQWGSASHRSAVRAVVAVVMPVMQHVPDCTPCVRDTFDLLCRYAGGEGIPVRDMRSAANNAAANILSVHSTNAAFTSDYGFTPAHYATKAVIAAVSAASQPCKSAASIVANSVSNNTSDACYYFIRTSTKDSNKAQCGIIRRVVPMVPKF